MTSKDGPVEVGGGRSSVSSWSAMESLSGTAKMMLDRRFQQLSKCMKPMLDIRVPGCEQTTADWWKSHSVVQQYNIGLKVSVALLLVTYCGLMWYMLGSEGFGSSTWTVATICLYGFSLDFVATKVLNFFFDDLKCFQDYLQSFLLYGICVLCSVVSSGLTSLSWGSYPWLLRTIVHDAFVIFIVEIIRHYRNLKHQEDEFRTLKSLEPYRNNISGFLWNITKVPLFNSILQWATLNMHLVNMDPTFGSSWRRLAIFPLKMLLTDLINDVWYWTMHRHWHSPDAYDTHKEHHTVKYPVTFVAAMMSDTEMLATFISNRFVTVVLMYMLFGQWTIAEFLCYQMALISIEVLGHSGQIAEGCNNTIRFGLGFIVESLGINLEVGHHDLHHELWNVNFGKRLCLMDKLFGTFKDHRDARKGATVS